jgi:hypothetical protein
MTTDTPVELTLPSTDVVRSKPNTAEVRRAWFRRNRF